MGLMMIIFKTVCGGFGDRNVTSPGSNITQVTEYNGMNGQKENGLKKWANDLPI